MAHPIFSLESYAASAVLKRESLDDALRWWPPAHDCLVYVAPTGKKFEVDACNSYFTNELDWFGIPQRFRFEEPFAAIDPEYSFIVTNDATVLGDTGVIVNASGNLVLESLFPHDRPRPFEKILEIPEFKTVGPKIVVDEDVFLLFRGGGFKNFWHFHVDMLPTLRFLKETGLIGRVKVAVPTMSQWHRDAIRQMGIDDDVIFEVNNACCTFRRAFLFSTIFNPYLTIPNALARRTFEDLNSSAGREGNSAPLPVSTELSLIYVARTDSTARMMVNEQTLIEALENAGFTIIIPSKLTYEQQQSAFANASVVVGAHGAGLTNIIYSKKNTLLVEIFPFGILNAPHYFFLAKSLGLRYEMFVSRIRSSVSPHEHWTLDVNAFIFKLALLLNRNGIASREKIVRSINMDKVSSLAAFGENIDIRFGGGNISEPFTRFGFSGLEPWGCWMCEPEGGIVFHFDLPARFRLSAKIEVFEPALSQPIRVQCDACTHEITRKCRSIDFIFENVGRSNTIWFEALGAISPAQANNDPFADNRRLSLAIKSLRIVEL